MQRVTHFHELIIQRLAVFHHNFPFFVSLLFVVLGILFVSLLNFSLVLHIE